MITRISAVSNNNYQYYRKNNNIKNISFQACTQKLFKPVMVNESLQKLVDKIGSFLQAMPEFSKLSKPMQIKFEKGVFGFMIDKTKPNSMKVSIKVKENSDKIESWDSLNEFKEGIEMIINNQGQMVEGSYYEVGANHILFERGYKNKRRIKHRNEYYRPVNNDIFSWRLIKAEQDALVGPSGYEYDKEGFISFFFELAGAKTSFFAKK